MSEIMPIKKMWDYAIENKGKVCTKEDKSVSVVKRREKRGV